MEAALRAWQGFELDERPTREQHCATYNVDCKSFRMRLKQLVILILELQLSMKN
jgi:hypothetical protein